MTAVPAEALPVQFFVHPVARTAYVEIRWKCEGRSLSVVGSGRTFTEATHAALYALKRATYFAHYQATYDSLRTLLLEPMTFTQQQAERLKGTGPGYRPGYSARSRKKRYN